MPLVFGDEQTTPYIKYNAKENQWSVNGQDGEIVDIDPPRLLMDLEHIEVGWFCFREAQAPDIVLDPPGDEEAPEPDGGNHKRGFRLQTYSKTFGAREFSSNSWMLKQAMKQLWKPFEEGMPQNPGQVPLVEATDHLAVTGKYGTNYRPVFRITGWYARPSELPAPTSTATQPAAEVADELNDEIAF